MILFICQYCGRETTNAGANKAHENRCILNTNKIEYENKQGRKPGFKSENQYTKAKRLSLPKPKLPDSTLKKMSEKTKKQKHTQETRDKISKARIKYLSENPNMVPYKLNHYSKGRSYPEKYWKKILDLYGIVYTEQFQIHTYQLDFALIEQKIDIEIDGEQHYLDERIAKSDERRNLYLSELGWKIIRIRWSDFKKLSDRKDRRIFVENILKEIRTDTQVVKGN